MTIPTSTILVVDDELQNRKLFEALLRAEGYLTVSVSNGEEALTSITACQPDLILLDVMMPGMDGYQVASLLKANPATSNIPIIMVTALIDRKARLAGLNAGAEDFLTKPVDRAELSLRVRNLLRLKAFGDFLQSQSWMLEQQVTARTTDLQRFRTAMDATADAIMLINRSTMSFVEVNTTTCDMLGYTREELLERGPARLGGASREQLEAVYDALIDGRAAGELGEIQLRRKDGSELHVELHRQVMRSGSDWIIVTVARDISERKDAEKRLRHIAHHDALTGLPNRTLFYETLSRRCQAPVTVDCPIAVLVIDVDYFKNVNDTLGHGIGDALLCQFGNRLIECIPASDLVGRMGGDEFAVILSMLDGLPGVTAVADTIREMLRTPFTVHGHEVQITASIGITVYPDDASDPDTLVKYADTAMYSAKQAGRDTYRFFTAQMNADVLARLDLETALRRALENGEFVLHYQPKVQIASGRIAGLEALLRWHRPGHGIVPPLTFIPVLEEMGLIVPVGSWVVATVCRQIGQWVRSSIGPVQVAVNVAGRQFIEGDLEGDVLRALQENQIAADLLELELTESSLMVNTERTISCLSNLRKHGVQISIDDFGTGYSSLAYLRHFPIDKLKIDIAFIRNITTNPDDSAIALAIISMAHSLKLEVVAEGVETAAQLAYLRRHRCNYIQGHYFSPAVALPELEHMLAADTCLPCPEGTPKPQRKTLLLVDDEASVLASLRRVLRLDGYHILQAGSADEGFELLAQHPVQVIVCDQRMPDMSGTEFLDRVKDLYPDTFRIVLSGYIDLKSIMDAINRGAIYRFYIKPWDNQVLRDNIRQAFSHYWLLHDMDRVEEDRDAQTDGADPLSYN